jgi:hypothetical protein
MLERNPHGSKALSFSGGEAPFTEPCALAQPGRRPGLYGVHTQATLWKPKEGIALGCVSPEQPAHDWCRVFRQQVRSDLQ